jgi:hypothetical protein
MILEQFAICRTKWRTWKPPLCRSGPFHDIVTPFIHTNQNQGWRAILFKCKIGTNADDTWLGKNTLKYVPAKESANDSLRRNCLTKTLDHRPCLLNRNSVILTPGKHHLLIGCGCSHERGKKQYKSCQQRYPNCYQYNFLLFWHMVISFRVRVTQVLTRTDLLIVTDGIVQQQTTNGALSRVCGRSQISKTEVEQRKKQAKVSLEVG